MDAENTLLPFAGSYGEAKGRRFITFYSSGTGFAGVVGSLWPIIMEDALHLSLGVMALIGLVFPTFYMCAYFFFLDRDKTHHTDESTASTAAAAADVEANGKSFYGDILRDRDGNKDDEETSTTTTTTGGGGMTFTKDKGKLTSMQRLMEVLGLWYFIVPLTVVYFAEYFIQSGLWSSIGVPSAYVKEDRQLFYHYAALCYQIGVFMSRSSGLLFNATVPLLWAIPTGQCILGALFACIAIYQFWTGWTLLIPALCVGLFGGACYVQ